MSQDNICTSGDLMKFLENFQKKMDENMRETNVNIENTNKKIDARLDVIDTEVK